MHLLMNGIKGGKTCKVWKAGYKYLLLNDIPSVSEGPPEDASHVPIFILCLLEQLDPDVWDCHSHLKIKSSPTLSDWPE